MRTPLTISAIRFGGTARRSSYVARRFAGCPMTRVYQGTPLRAPGPDAETESDSDSDSDTDPETESDPDSDTDPDG